MVAAGTGQLMSAMKIGPNCSAIAQLFPRGVVPRRIAERSKMLPRTVYEIVKQFKELGHVEEKPRSERPHSIDVSRVRRAIKKRNDGVSLDKIASDPDISRGSVRNTVKCELGPRSYRSLQGHTPMYKTVMVWEWIRATGKTTLVFSEKGIKINARYYRDEVLLP